MYLVPISFVLLCPALIFALFSRFFRLYFAYSHTNSLIVALFSPYFAYVHFLVR
jgi:hypothetical protein